MDTPFAHLESDKQNGINWVAAEDQVKTGTFYSHSMTIKERK